MKSSRPLRTFVVVSTCPEAHSMHVEAMGRELALATYLKMFGKHVMAGHAFAVAPLKSKGDDYDVYSLTYGMELVDSVDGESFKALAIMLTRGLERAAA